MKRLLLLTITAISFSSANSQGSQAKVLADKIVAVVGNEIVLRSDLINGAADNKRHHIDVASGEDCDLLTDIIMHKALIAQAQKDSLHVDEQEIEAELEQRIRYFIRLYGSKEALEQIAGKTIYQIKEDNRKFIRDLKLADAEQAAITERIAVTPAEVKSYYNSIQKNELNFYETAVEINEVVLYAKPGPEMEQYAKDELTSFKKKIEQGEFSFEMVARMYSDDKDTYKNGGLLEYNRNDNTEDPLFLQTVFSLKEGQLSKVFKTNSGYHLVQLISRNGDDVVIRHILKRPVITETAMQKTMERLDTIRFGLVAKAFTFSNAVERYSEDPKSKFTAGAVTNLKGSVYLTIQELDKDVVVRLDKLKNGEYSEPFAFTDENGRRGAKLLYLKSKTEPHIENLKDDYDKIAQRLIAQKKTAALNKWFQQYINKYYVAVGSDYASCGHFNDRLY
ncbi:MAG: peptidylprolyl isomerase [Agriterribacter sp.]